MESITNLFVQIFTAAVSWFDSVYSAIPGAYSFVLAAFMMLLTYRFLLRPLIGGAGSDKVKKSKKNGNSSSSKEGDS